MKKRNKLIALLLAMTMGSVALAGCGSKTSISGTEIQETVSSQKTTDATETAASASTEAADDGTWVNADIYPLSSDKTFTVVTSVDVYGDKEYNVYTQAMERATGVSINYVKMDKDQLKLAITSKEFPELIYHYSNALTKTEINEYGKAGYLVNYMDYIDIMPNLAAFLEKYPMVAKEAVNEDGTMYNLPAVSGAASAQNNLIYIRTDMMKEIGWENPPATTDEFLQYIVELQEHFGAKDKEFIAFNFHQGKQLKPSTMGGNLFLFAAFGELLRFDIQVHDDKVVYGMATEQYKHYLEYMNKLFTSGAFNTNIYTQEAAASQALAANNKVGVVVVNTGLSLDNFQSGNFDLEVLEPLTSEYYNEKHWLKNKMYTPARCYLLSTQCQDIEIMCQWLDAWYSEPDNPLNEEGTMWGWTPAVGEVGVDFTLDDEKSELVKITDPKSGAAIGTPYSGFENAQITYLTNRNSGLGAKEHGTKNNLWPYAVTPVIHSDLTLTQDEQDIYNDAIADINTFVEERTAKFITGELNVAEEWDNYLSELEKMGLKDVIDVYQAAYERYKEK